MATMEEYARWPLERRVERLRRAPADVEEALRGRDAAALARRPDPATWSATEIICHRRDVEELFLTRFLTVLAVDEPSILAFGAPSAALAGWGIGEGVGHPLDPDRWAVERQYRRNDPAEALTAFARRRTETLVVLDRLTPGQWQRAGVHTGRGRLTIADFAASLAGHDDNHVAQLRRALLGQP
jgi:hypothetical protein